MLCERRRQRYVRTVANLVCRIACVQNAVITKDGKSYKKNRPNTLVRSRSKNEVPLTGKVVLDGMGSDHAPHAEIDGALAATRDFGVGVILVGQSEKLEPELRRCGWRGDGDQGIDLVEAPEGIAMDNPVANSVRRKKKSSLRIGTKLVDEGKADGFVSAGNT